MFIELGAIDDEDEDNLVVEESKSSDEERSLSTSHPLSIKWLEIWTKVLESIKTIQIVLGLPKEEGEIIMRDIQYNLSEQLKQVRKLSC